MGTRVSNHTNVIIVRNPLHNDAVWSHIKTKSTVLNVPCHTKRDAKRSTSVRSAASQPVMFANTTSMHARHIHVLIRVRLTSTLPKSRRNHSMVVANYSPVGKTQQKTHKLHFKFPIPKMTPHECHMLKINVQL